MVSCTPGLDKAHLDSAVKRRKNVGMRILVTGASGLIGKKLTQRLLAQGHEVHTLKLRSDSPPLDDESLQGCEAVIHLAGEPIANGRWTKIKKKRIWDSRILGTQKIVHAIEALPTKKRPRVLICASAIGYYGDGFEAALNETSPAGSGFLPNLVKEWEASARQAEKFGVRVVSPRFGVVLSKAGGALPKMGPAVLGSGRQWMSWVHIEDVARFIEMSLVNEDIRGVYNLTTPVPVRHRDFIRSLWPNFPFLLPMPAFVLRLILGDMAQLLLDSQKVLPERTLKTGFQFCFPNLKVALDDLFGKRVA